MGRGVRNAMQLLYTTGMETGQDSNETPVAGVVVRRRRWGRVAFWGCLILIGPGLWAASYWQEFFVDLSSVESRWLCMTIGSGRLTLSYNGDDLPPTPASGGFPDNPYQIHQGMFSVKRMLFLGVRTENQNVRAKVERRLQSATTEEQVTAIRQRLEELDKHIAEQEAEHARWYDEQRRVTSGWLNQGLANEVWFVENTSTSGLMLRTPIAGFILHVHLIIPLGLVCIVAIGVRAIVKRVREAREREGLCESCGYNLTGNTSGVCPECGTAVPETTTIPAVAPVEEA